MQSDRIPFILGILVVTTDLCQMRLKESQNDMLISYVKKYISSAFLNILFDNISRETTE